MSDQKLRELERRWRETKSVEDEAAYLRERVRVGELTKERLELAAYLGDPASVRAVGARGVPRELKTWLNGWVSQHGPFRAGHDSMEFVIGLEQWGDSTLVRAIAVVAGNGDVQPEEHSVLAAISDWCDCPCREHANQVHERVPRDVPVGSSATAALGALVAQSALGADRLDKTGSKRALACFALNASVRRGSAAAADVPAIVRAGLLPRVRATD